MPDRCQIASLLGSLALKLALLSAYGAAVAAEAIELPPEQMAAYEADGPKSILELQPFRQHWSIPAHDGKDRHGSATLIELNPNVNAWFILSLTWNDGSAFSYHLENPYPQSQRLALKPSQPRGLYIDTEDKSRICKLWLGEPSAIARASTSSLPYAPLCGNRLYLRNTVEGRRTDLERVTDFLRDHVWGGEAVVGFVRNQFYQDAYLDRGAPSPGSSADLSSHLEGPRPALLNEAYVGRKMAPGHLGIALDDTTSPQLAIGQWYPAAKASSVYLSVIQPQAVSQDILTGHAETLAPLDPVEAQAIDYLIAFDLADLDLGFALGTDHPRVHWSKRPPAEIRGTSMPGPDGIGSIAPLVTNGTIGPTLVDRTVAAFTGGFKRSHGAFKYGDLAVRNRGSHYGFAEGGTILSKLQPGLATFYRLEDGSLDMKTWSEADDVLLPRIQFARQNGVPLVDIDPRTGQSRPGDLVKYWGRGNWSGTAEGKFRALRAGACLQETSEGSFLIYGYFSSATPSAMARVFQAYGCRYAMHLDMNALEHTYLALYHRRGDHVVIEHLIKGMEVVDKSLDDNALPRFTAVPDNRDFFYVIKRDDKK
ncbi:MAG: hypothetical protein ACR2QJ_17620 [Geminicoccaceae bacterium]